MAFYVEKMIFHNRAPFKHLELNFEENEVALITAINGGGKTTILSHLVDAWYEMVRKACPQEFENKEGKYYRISSTLYALDDKEPSLVYIRFKNNGDSFDYIDLRGECGAAEYDQIITLENKLSYESFKENLADNKNIKYFSEATKQQLGEIFSSNIITSFPSYRYEQPGYLNDPFRVKLNYNLSMKYSGYLKNPIEVISGLPELANWIMDIVLDQTTGMASKMVFSNINQIFSEVLRAKNEGQPVKLGIGPRNYDITRIQVVAKSTNGGYSPLYPSIFNMSSGENAAVCIFGEILRQYDNIYPNGPLGSARGIVVIDEIDKHLHIKLQKEVLSHLIQLFPNVQFIISSHSPFVTMGLAEVLQDRTKIFDLDCDGMAIKPEENSQYQEVYNAMIEENKRFYDNYQRLLSSQSQSDGPLLIVSEGNNITHIKKAIETLEPALLEEIEFLEGLEDCSGKGQLLAMYRYEVANSRTSRVLFVCDCDAKAQVDGAPDETEYAFKFALPNNPENTKAKKGIENLYPADLFTSDVYDEILETDDYGAEKLIGSFNKSRFLTEKIQKSTDKNIFAKFQPLIDKIKKILKK